MTSDYEKLLHEMAGGMQEREPAPEPEEPENAGPIALREDHRGSVDVEALAEAAHVAQLAYIRRMRWPLQPKYALDFEFLPEDVKELNRVAARAVLDALLEQYGEKRDPVQDLAAELREVTLLTPTESRDLALHILKNPERLALLASRLPKGG